MYLLVNISVLFGLCLLFLLGECDIKGCAQLVITQKETKRIII